MVDVFLCSCTTVVLLLLVSTKILCGESAQVPDINDNPYVEENKLHFLDERDFRNYSKRHEEYRRADYPFKKIAEIMKALEKNSINSIKPIRKDSPSTNNIAKADMKYPTSKASRTRMSSLHRIGDTKCIEDQYELFLIRGKDIYGKDYYIVNVEGHQQKMNYIFCRNKGDKCGDKSRTPENYDDFCDEAYTTIELMAFLTTEEITPKAVSRRPFNIPIGCNCWSKRRHEDV
ncbi:uncharacterized protein LOC106639056 [Copidosoma floridanum]|uniref:uncharacterized protein LOC106639056 n=1 Tax=Copidosoma floridanum TaxID=29053 RepID=UPI0006C992AF|nr:uncharacterized protein LOC106639056 [Copidosoma floridanum]XP_014207978.1 uncharacterized protein LOC106639056 [Copidosoma floridanum]XP_014207979.1 uncharacterized protein LOC106639056 [Copidosoma floridanum]XP_023247541.1 uncharacterized protein LOC106639056 [Copidosoma floridanum]XP_023247542.1 uncharacterized protein LOC106639056 [Copidosoma floridanum]